MTLDVLKSDFEKMSYLLNLLVARATGKFADPDEYEIVRRELLTKQHIAASVPTWLKTCRSIDAFWDFIKSQFPTYAERRTFLLQELTPVLDFLEFGAPNDTANHPPSQQELSRPVARNKRKVFIVHGRDNEVKLEVSRFIEKMGLQTIILHEQASTGKTIIEKIEHYSNDADFALVLYTACDQGRGIHEGKLPPRYRARQNVVFEHGYLMAKLGRQNVCALVKGDIKLPNDLSGVVYLPFDGPALWKAEVFKELRACGYDVSFPAT
jgi:predicted nucleotide-binding protein